MSAGYLSLFKSLKQPNLRGTLFYGWPGYKSVASFLFFLGWLFMGYNSLALNSQSRFYVLSIVSIVSSCIDVACHVNMHFGVSAEKIKRHCFITSVSFCLFSTLKAGLQQHKLPAQMLLHHFNMEAWNIINYTIITSFYFTHGSVIK